MAETLDNPVRQPDPNQFGSALARIDQRFAVYAATCPQPLASPGLRIDAEIRRQSELYLPLAEIRRLFARYYRAGLHHGPIISSSPFQVALSWADLYAGLPPWLQLSPNPAGLLRRLLHDPDLHERFLYYSFLPQRYNGAGFERYPLQLAWIGQWFAHRCGSGHAGELRCLDAACGSGEGTWELVTAAADAGWLPEQASFTGWTLDPLEVYAAQQRYLPHLPDRQQAYRQRVAPLLRQGWQERVVFQAADLLSATVSESGFDLILCNGLLGGPIISTLQRVRQVIGQLAQRLEPGGVLLAANHFHDGWRNRMPDTALLELFRAAGLRPLAIEEGIAAQRSES